ncbi:geranylgeranyl pyrophosphate synthase-like [Pararge aegeria]|uniref:geranylgeranyl pyrophosphate synthase-like n=1 Tax=Pararge aegeria TaxID=116150 RepID=UPI0019CFC697|nr:geranylgeranyl pyrophosphate synthase-like [Pararge aegeria]
MEQGAKSKNDNNLYLEKLQELLAPYYHLLKVRGKQMRLKIALAFNHWLRLPDDKLRYIVETLKMLHNAGLLMDDIQDNSNIRRGIPAAHSVFGLPLTINTSMHIVLLVLARIIDLGHKAVEIFTEEMTDAIRGQGLDIYWRDNFVCPDEEEYKDMLKKKTGRAFTMAVKLMQIHSEYQTDLNPLALNLGLYFQIRDDYCNLMVQEALEDWPTVEDKPKQEDTIFCEDLTEGKFSLPIIHALKTPVREQVLSILRQRTQDIEVKKRCVSLLDKVGSFQYTRDVLSELDQIVRAEVARLGGNPDMEVILGELLSWKHEEK